MQPDELNARQAPHNDAALAVRSCRCHKCNCEHGARNCGEPIPGSPFRLRRGPWHDSTPPRQHGAQRGSLRIAESTSASAREGVPREDSVATIPIALPALFRPVDQKGLDRFRENGAGRDPYPGANPGCTVGLAAFGPTPLPGNEVLRRADVQLQAMVRVRQAARAP